MSITTMYDGANNSIYTTLTSTAASTDTTINVVSTANLPDAPNIATIGVSDSAEVVLYSGKTGISLTGCTRGFGGTSAATWAAGQYVYRAFTKYDHDTFKDNIEDLDTRIGGFQPETSTLTAETTLADDDYVPFLDTSVSANRKSTWSNIVAKIVTALFGTTNGILKANGSGVISAAVSNTDYAAATHKTRHATGGADALSPADIGAASTSDIATKADLVGSYIDPEQSAVEINAQTDNYTVLYTDNGKDVWITNASDKTLTIATQAVGEYPDNFYFFLTRYGAGAVTIAGAGTTIRSTGSRLKVAEQYGTVLVRKTDTDVWLVTGSLSA